MQCPKCHFDHPLQTTECLKCGIVFSRYKPVAQPSAMHSFPDAQIEKELPAASTDSLADRSQASWELKCRLLALPLALLAAYLLSGTGFVMVGGMLAMVLHETGHAITAWLSGRWAVPLLWVTYRGDNRSWSVVLIVTAAIGLAGFLAWKTRRWGLLCAAGGVFLLQAVIAIQPSFTQGSLIVFGGDGGALVLATLLMAAFYAPAGSWLRQSWGLRWGFLAIGALSFFAVFRIWSGPIEGIPFGEIEGVNLSDPGLLTETYGWSVTQLIHRYQLLAAVSLAALLAVYLWGLASAYLVTRSTQQDNPASQPNQLPHSTPSSS
jgi:hypothetical protein